MQSHSTVHYKQILFFKQMTTPKFLQQIMKEFKGQTNNRFSNLATTIERSQQTFNVLKYQENLTVRCTVRTGSFLEYDCPTVHEGTVPHDCTRQRTCSGNDCPRSRSGPEAAQQTVRRQTNGGFTAPRRLSATVNVQRRRTSDFDPDG